MSPPRSGLGGNSVLLPLALLLGLVLLAVSPAGDFPLNDDWAYAKQVRVLLLEHRFESGVMALAFAQTVWGALFASLAGASHTALRLSTLALALVTVWATARLALETGLPRWAALVCAAVVLGNPIFLNLAYTFMTEVPFMAPFTVAGLLYGRSLKEGRTGDLLLAGALAVTAASIRQFGVLIAGAYLLAEGLLLLSGRRPFSPLRAAAFLAPWALGAAAYLAMPGLEGRPPILGEPARLTTLTVLGRTVRDLCTGLVYAGLFLLPLAAGRLAHLLRRPSAWPAARWASLPAVCALIFAGTGRLGGNGPAFRPLPLLGNILYDTGTGPLTLRDTYLWGMTRPVTLPPWWWWALTALSVLAAAVFCADVLPPAAKYLLSVFRPSRAGGEGAAPLDLFLVLWAGSIVAAPYHLVMSGSFDRYLVPALPPLAVLAARSLRAPTLRAMPAALAVLCLLYALPSVACTQDYMAWNGARWRALDHLRDDHGALPFQVDGGYEFNASYTRDAYLKATGANPHDGGPRGFWVMGDRFAVSFNPREGYEEIGRFPYFSWLGMEERGILALRRRQ